jgi:hypothetical protein
MAAPMSVETTKAAFDLPSVGRNPNSVHDTPHGSHGLEPSFRSDWQALFGFGKLAGDQAALENSNAIQDSANGATRAKDLKNSHKSARERHPQHVGETGPQHGLHIEVAEQVSRPDISTAELAKAVTADLSLTAGPRPLPIAESQQAIESPGHALSNSKSEQTVSAERSLPAQQPLRIENSIATGSPFPRRNELQATEPSDVERLKQPTASEEPAATPAILTKSETFHAATNGGNSVQGTGSVGLAPQIQIPGAVRPVTDRQEAVTPARPVTPNSTSADESKSQIHVQARKEGALSSNKGTAIESTAATGAANSAHSTSRKVPSLFPQVQSGVALTHGLSGLQEATHRDGSDEMLSRPSSLTSRVGSTVQQTFAALDGGDGGQATKWTQIARTRAEAGFEDPTLGWVGVRAQAGSDGVHAIVAPDSPDAVQSLAAHLSGLSAYLSEHHTPVQTLTVATPESPLGQHAMEPGGGQGSGQGSGRDENFAQANNSLPIQASGSSLVPVEDGNGGVSRRIANGGVYISVVA